MTKQQIGVTFNDDVFEQILESAGVENLCRQKAEQALKVAQSTAPVKTGAYRDGLQVREAQRGHRTAYLVVGEDWKTMLVESKTGNLARALKAVRG